jgi:hypothetical protein
MEIPVAASSTRCQSDFDPHFRCAKTPIFFSPFNLIWAVQTSRKKYFASRLAQITC